MKKKVTLSLKPSSRQFYFFVFLKTIANIFIFSGIFYLTWAFYPIIQLEIRYALKNDSKQTSAPTEPLSTNGTDYVPLENEPIEDEGTLIIPKIDVSSPILFDVSITDTNEYFSALERGIAHAKGTQYPSKEIGNTYLFAHSTLNPSEITKYGAAFTLLNKLEKGDSAYIYHQNKRYTYIVYDSSVVEAFDLSPLLDPVQESTLTLQTCDPPGIPINRLIVRAKLIATEKIP